MKNSYIVVVVLLKSVKNTLNCCNMWMIFVDLHVVGDFWCRILMGRMSLLTNSKGKLSWLWMLLQNGILIYCFQIRFSLFGMGYWILRSNWWIWVSIQWVDVVKLFWTLSYIWEVQDSRWAKIEWRGHEFICYHCLLTLSVDPLICDLSNTLSSAFCKCFLILRCYP